MTASSPKKLVQGVDYYVEAGKFVFTSAYHRKRGYCCNSRCRHCPYGLGREDVPAVAAMVVEILGLPGEDPAPPKREG